MLYCKHRTPATLDSDVEYLARFGINPDCISCPMVEWDENTNSHVPPTAVLA
jgi:hypothetical protein